MKEKLSDEIKDLFAQSKEWVALEVEYAKLTVAEKFTVLVSAMIIGAICLAMGIVVLTMAMFAVVEVFRLMMPPWLAYLAVGGIICVLVLLIYLMRRPLILNPIAKFITKLFFSK